MRILLLTNHEHIDFVASVTISDLREYDEISYKYTGEYDWLGEDYDVGISFMYQHKVPAKEVNSHPWFNFHPAPLPGYKGRDLCYHAIVNGEKEFGATLHYMDENFDAGDIIDKVTFHIGEHWTAMDVSAFAVEYSKRLFEVYFPKILETRVFPRIPNRGGTYYKKGKIIEEVPVDPNSDFGQFVRAVSFPSKGFHPRIDIGGVKYKIVREK